MWWSLLVLARAAEVPAVPEPGPVAAPDAPSPAPAPEAPGGEAPAVEPAPVEPAPVEAVPPVRAAPPNVLILVADDVGVDKIGAYGEHPQAPRTPHIDQLAQQGVRFRNGYSYALCSPTRAAVLTGRYGRRNGLGVIITWNGRWELPREEVTIPELLDRSGTDWSTAALGKWHLSGPTTPSGFRGPNEQGFDHYAGSINNLYFEDGEAKRGAANYFHWEKDVDGVVESVDTYATATTTTDALATVATMREPWFLYVAYNAAHGPFHVPPGAGIPDGAPVAVRHAAMVEDLDREIGRLLAGLPPGQREHTVIVFIGDNGTPHEAILPPRLPAHGKGSLFEGGTNVPFLVSGPGVFRGGVSDALVHVVDILPSVAELAGVDPALTRAPVDGVSFVDVLRDPSAPGRRRFVYTERFGPAGRPPYRTDDRAVRDERYKLMVMSDGEWFFDLMGRNDDGPGRRPEQLSPEEHERYLLLKAELERIDRETRFAY